MFSVFPLKMLFPRVKHFCVEAGNQCRTACVFITFRYILFVNIVHVCVICLTQTSMINQTFIIQCIKSTAVSYICSYILLHQYFFYQKCFECVTWNFLGHNYYLNVVLNYQYDIDVVTDEQVSQGTIYIQTLYV